jgi:dimethylamine/trimethylamine dehydrogenase
MVSQWSVNTMEQERIQARLLSIGVELVLSHRLVSIGGAGVELACAYTGRVRSLPAASVGLVTARVADDALYLDLMSHEQAFADLGIRSVTRVGDCLAPGTIAAAVYSGHRWAREVGATAVQEVPFQREGVFAHFATGAI